MGSGCPAPCRAEYFICGINDQSMKVLAQSKLEVAYVHAPSSTIYLHCKEPGSLT